MVIDSSDNIILGGNTASYGDGYLGYCDMCLVKYNSLGVLQWDMVWERAAGHYEFNDDLVIDSSGNIFTFIHDLNTNIPILAKFDNSGNEIWNRTYPGLGFFGVSEMEIDAFDNLYITDTFDYRDFGFAKFNKYGDFLWSETWGTLDDEFCTSIALNSTDHVYLAGYRSFHSYGPMILVKFKINPPEAPYFTDIQENFTMYEGDISKSLVWTPIDESMFYDSYWIMQNETKIMEGEWDGSQITYSNLEELIPGIYNFTCFVNNTYGKLNSSSIFFTILPNLHTPNIDRNTSDLILNIGTSNFIISWHAIDLDGNNNSFWITRNSSILASGTWNNDSDIIFMESEILNVGYYNYTCFVNDTSGLKNQTSIYIQIINHDPIIFNNSIDFIVNVGTTGYSLSWHASDIDGNTLIYWIERNGGLVAQDSWVNDSDIIYVESEFLSAGIYNYTCFVSDTTGALNQSSIFVKINSYPYYSDVTLPLNHIYEQDADYVFNCTWTDIDGTIGKVLLEFDSFNFTVTTNKSGIFTFILNDLNANENGYNYRWHAMDNDGAWTSTDWKNFVLNKKVIELIILFNGTEDNYFYDLNPFINITVINLNSTPGKINLYVDGELIQQETGYLLVNISQFSLGSFNITAILTDENYTGSIMSWLHLSESIPPEIIFEFSESYVNLTEPEYFHDEIEVICTVNDFSLVSWVYCCENSSGTFLNHSMSSLGNSNWTFTIDISGLNWNDAISVSFFARDTWGNIGLNNNFTKLYTIRIHDFQKPVTTLSFIPHEGTNIVNKSTKFSLTGDDGLGSGIEIIRYKINGSGWSDYSASFNLTNYSEGFYNISYYSIDHAGNVEEINSIIIELIEVPQETPKSSSAIPGFDIFFIFGMIALMTIFLIWRRVEIKI
ncbi:MAG: hypothetical protein CEE43_00355 [Promethearchaeota archaeon Loki_b32]|nr:MAG: hypothetical protein CEE43_00355 [Candidatus Lokiarchaeota archaeon Loki_b32]